MAGHPDDRLHRPRLRAVADEALPAGPTARSTSCGWWSTADGDGAGVRPCVVGGQGSHQLAPMARANALAVLPDGDGVAAGGPVGPAVEPVSCRAVGEPGPVLLRRTPVAC